MFVFGLIGAATHRMLIRRGFGHLRAARDGQDRLFHHFRTLTEGFKELKLHRGRREAYLGRDVTGATAACQKHNVAAEQRFIIAQNWNQTLFLALIGLILFALPALSHVSPRAMTGYVIATLYLMGPLAGLLGSLSVFSRANVSLHKVEQLGLTLSAQPHDNGTTPGGRASFPGPFQSLELSQVSHRYQREGGGEDFVLGPIDFTLRPGEVAFLTGGNGSGKSTLAKVVTGLYPPSGGEVRLNGRAVGDHNRDDYRQCFSAVFSDYFLFDSVASPGAEADRRAQAYIERLHLAHKVSIKNGVFSTTQLSQGQRKRLALLCAYIEDRPFYLFDEWASDQDPLFKEVFYSRLLPELRTLGKAVLVITHDDRYFHCADRLIKLDYGQIASEPAGEMTVTGEPQALEKAGSIF
jgi:putative ATP-binding cassette transporter